MKGIRSLDVEPRGMRRALLATILVASALFPATAQGCQGQAWFLGAIHDDAQRSDFVLDVDNFEFFRAQLSATHCIPPQNAEILAFDGAFARGGRTYAAATEQNLLDRIARYGAAAPSGSTFFLMLSSHGNSYRNGLCDGARRAAGSFAQLKTHLGAGTVTDCELGAALNASFAPGVRMFVFVDCSFCGGFSDSLTAVSGTVVDGAALVSSGIPGAGRVVITGCAITTECFGGNEGGRSFSHFRRTMGPSACDGYTAPGFPMLQGVDAPARTLARDGRCTASEWFFAAVESAYRSLDAISIQQQFRIKYGLQNLQADIPIS